MALESDSSKVVRELLRPLHGKRIENMLEKGTPDWNYADGWIELKHADYWPKRGGRLKLRHYTADQRIFQHKRGKVGNVFMLWHVGKDWYLFDSKFAFGQLYLEGVTEAEAQKNSIEYWIGRPNGEEFRACLN